MNDLIYKMRKEGFTFDVIAERVGKSTNSVKKRYYRYAEKLAISDQADIKIRVYAYARGWYDAVFNVTDDKQVHQNIYECEPMVFGWRIMFYDEGDEIHAKAWRSVNGEMQWFWIDLRGAK